MNALEQLLEFISRLQDSNIDFTLHCVRDAIMVAIVSPRTYYEVEFFSDGHIEVQAWGRQIQYRESASTKLPKSLRTRSSGRCLKSDQSRYLHASA
jgi:hypothetical protein